MTVAKRSVLITGCSDGGMGSALAIAFDNAGFKVYATARNPSKMQDLSSPDIVKLTLDVTSQESIKACVKAIDSLDVLVNNAGAVQPMPLVDASISRAKELFDLNVWSQLAVIQAFIPFLIKSNNGMLVNHTSTAAVLGIPFGGVYAASKAAFSSLSETLRLELQPFDIKVVDLRTAMVKTNISQNSVSANNTTLPEDSIYAPAKAVVEKAIRGEMLEGNTNPMSAEHWARLVVSDLSKSSPPAHIWRGDQAWLVRLTTWLPHGMLDGKVKQLTGLADAEKLLRQS